MIKKAALMLLGSMLVTAARAQSAENVQTVTVWSDFPAVYAEVDTHTGVLWKVVGYRAGGMMSSHKFFNASVGTQSDERTFSLKNIGGGALTATSDSNVIIEEKTAFAFSNNGQWDANYYPRSKEGKTTEITVSQTTGDISGEVMLFLSNKYIGGVGGSAKTRYDSGRGYCADNTGGHGYGIRCGDYNSSASCPGPGCRWISTSSPSDAEEDHSSHTLQ